MLTNDPQLHPPCVLAVDDTPDVLSLLSKLLSPCYRVKVANSGERALQIMQTGPLPDLVLLDILMPGMNGHDVCRRLKAEERTRDIPVLFLSALTDKEDEQAGFEAGAVDYITKPISPPVLLARIKAQLALKATADFLRDRAAFLDAEVARRTRELVAIQNVTILCMASLAETRDNETGNHIRRTQHYVHSLALHLRHTPRFAPQLSDAFIECLYRSAPLHDIGKVGIPDHILLKPGPLEPGEWEIMKTHTTLGYEAIAHAEHELGAPVEFLSMAKEIALSHHERWDGTGYPQGLAGEAIPLSARLMTLADVYDALISQRCYKTAIGHEQARDIIARGKGSHFDPDIADAFLAIEDEFRSIARRYADHVPR